MGAEPPTKRWIEPVSSRSTRYPGFEQAPLGPSALEAVASKLFAKAALIPSAAARPKNARLDSLPFATLSLRKRSSSFIVVPLPPSLYGSCFDFASARPGLITAFMRLFSRGLLLPPNPLQPCWAGLGRP